MYVLLHKERQKTSKVGWWGGGEICLNIASPQLNAPCFFMSKYGNICYYILLKSHPSCCMWGATTHSTGDRNHNHGLLRNKTKHLYSLQMMWQPPASQLQHPWLLCLCKKECLFVVSSMTRYTSCCSLPFSPVISIAQRAACTSRHSFMVSTWGTHAHPSLNWTSSKFCLHQ